MLIFFFFSSRRRHTRLQGDWSSDVCSSDLVQQELLPRISIEVAYNRRWWGNYTVTDNQNVSPEMYDSYVVTAPVRSEEHTSELQSPCNLVCRLLLEKKKEKATKEKTSRQTY